MSNTLGTWTVALTFLIVVFYVMSQAGQDILNNDHQRMDNTSVSLLGNAVYDNFDRGFLNTTQNDSLTDASSQASGEDDFALEYKESVANANTNKNVLVQIYSMPDVLLSSLGVKSTTMLTTIKSILIGLMALFIGFATYKMFRTGQTD